MAIPDEIKASVEAAVGVAIDVWLSDKPTLKAVFDHLPEMRAETITNLSQHPLYVQAMDLLDKAGDNLELVNGIVALIRDLVPLIIGTAAGL